MSTVYPVECCGYKFKTSEHLFIALRFSGYPDLQRKILTILRDNGSIDYKIDYPLFLFDNEIK